MNFAELQDEACQKLHDNICKQEKIELLNWFMQLCGSGATTGMIRKLVHNKLVEITGDGERA